MTISRKLCAAFAEILAFYVSPQRVLSEPDWTQRMLPDDLRALRPLIYVTTNGSSLNSLPALASLGDLRGAEIVVVVDSREITPLPITRLPFVTDTIQTGDYSFRGGESLLAIERKTVPDFISCCKTPNRERFERELHRLRGYRWKQLLIIGSEREIMFGHRFSGMNRDSLRDFSARHEPEVGHRTRCRCRLTATFSATLRLVTRMFLLGQIEANSPVFKEGRSSRPGSLKTHSIFWFLRSCQEEAGNAITFVRDNEDALFSEQTPQQFVFT
jgi:hypothetical protein